MRFLINVIDSSIPQPGNSSEMAAIDSFNESLQNNGNWIFAWGLQAPAKAKFIDNRESKNLIESRPLVDGPENISGFWLIEAPDEATAELLALEASKACNRKVELRPLH